MLVEPRRSIRPDRHLPVRSAPARADHAWDEGVRRRLRRRAAIWSICCARATTSTARTPIPRRSPPSSQLAAALAPRLPAENFRAEPLDRLSFPEAFADVVLSSAVLHFAENDADFDAMLHGTWRMLKPGGLFFCRLASLTGIASDARPLGHGRYLLPDGSERYLIDDDRLLDLTDRLNGTLLDPIKTTVVHAQRAMTTWVVRKRR